ncbi:MAG: hypothetical protein R2824_32330 [Saprospiraceae bacterium]|nr:hypothetical protein [Lewinella sp.]
MKKGYLYSGIVLLLIILGCFKEKFTERNFFSVRITSVEPEPNMEWGSLNLEAEVVPETGKVLDIELEEKGFLYTPLLNVSDGKLIDAVLVTSTQGFTITLEGLELDENYYFQAYARSAEREVFSDIKTFNFNGNFLIDPVIIENDQAFISANILGLKTVDDQGKEILQQVLDHGIIYSDQSLEPGNTNTFTLSLGAGLGNLRIDTVLNDLRFNTNYSYKLYVKTHNRQYDGPVNSFRVRDGWKRVKDFNKSLVDAWGLAYNEQGLVLFGMDTISTVYSNTTYEFHPDDEHWLVKPELEYPFEPTRIGIAFIADHKMYYGFGVIGQDYLNQLDYIDLKQPGNGWQTIVGPSNFIFSGRVSAVVFTHEDKAYIGTGSRFSNAANPEEILYNDFIEYNTSTNTWRKVAPLPLRNEGMENDSSGGRAGAIAFEVDRRYFVGLGQSSIASTQKDLWEFHPPKSDDIQDIGEWEFHSFFPGEGRKNAVVGVAGKKAFIGLGDRLNNRFSNDYWVFDPDTGWSKDMTQFPGDTRTQAVSFTIDNQVYMGLGRRSRAIENKFIEVYHRDFWVYFPRQE